MNKKTQTLAIAIFLTQATIAEEDPRLTKVRAQYESAQAKVTEQYETKCRELRTTYLRELDTLSRRQHREGNLDYVIQVREEKEKLASKSLAPPPTEAVGKNRNSFSQSISIEMKIDGSGLFSFTTGKIEYTHYHWKLPQNIKIGDEDWENLDRTPVVWKDLTQSIDLHSARIVEREGRDITALEITEEGFDLYVADSPNGAGDYELTIEFDKN